MRAGGLHGHDDLRLAPKPKRELHLRRVAAGVLRLGVRQMKLTIRLEIDDSVPRSGTATPVIAGTDDFPQRDRPGRISANFVAQLAATFLNCPQTRARRRIDLRDATKIYDDAAAARLVPASTAIRCKT